MPARKALHVLNVSLATNCETRSLEPAHTKLQAIERHDLKGVLAQIINEPRDTKHPPRHLCLELRLAGEDDNRLDGARR